MTLITRRSLIHTMLAAPAIVAAERLMPVRALVMPEPVLVVPDVQGVAFARDGIWIARDGEFKFYTGNPDLARHFHWQGVTP